MKVLKLNLILIGLITLSVNFSCKKFLEIDPPKDSATPKEVFSNDVIATSAVTGIYSRMATSGAFSGDENSISVFAGLSADELLSYSTVLNVFYVNDIPTTNTVVAGFWLEAYNNIYISNAILQGLASSNGVSEPAKKQLQGEVKFIRAFCYFYLVNIFGEVPLVLQTDYRLNQSLGKSSTQSVYSQIVSDLKDAESLLSPSYITTERIRPNKWAAAALLARVYLYNSQWSDALIKSNEVINEKLTYELLDDLDKIFLKNSKEAIWQLMPVAGSNTREGALFILTATPRFVSLSKAFVLEFESNDNRKLKWTNQFTTNYYYPWKYKISTTTNGSINEYSMVIRLAEIYLIRAEAKINQGDIPGGVADLNLVRQRPRANGTFSNGISALPTTLSKNNALLAVEKERRFEFFCEWGHRWLDLKRTGRATSVLSPIKGSSWKDTDVLYPIPNEEITRNPNLTPNNGY
ncbi:RagB/SusD family nutrient uptake outer membrane protein [Pedobacter hiemivivus]|uniref:RagB/SusD family nutrient uptake outer membrane protein n=1 Tax=Pedobacter hiemivivus TaxID=2530454 RepID=A0A4R0MNQ3_9SPHI|nr:RagB/SusD family nutrient uptake outer membrane protein [Pedobacter hiemivivus]TCC87852.1 RagB/SusD family nutrient uptake outer membrane protein [Pedobacter hiemivivus]